LQLQRQYDGQVLIGDGNDPTTGAINHGDRSSPIALPRYAPILNAKIDCFTSKKLFFKIINDSLASLKTFEPREGTGVDHSPLVNICLGHRVGVQCPVERLDYHPDRQAIFLGELEVALIVCRHRHDGARAVVHQDEISDPDGNQLLG
jgi:hypothetical protein